MAIILVGEVTEMRYEPHPIIAWLFLALFVFIPLGVWKAVEIILGLFK